MKTLTLTQPWATLVAIGAKKIETRSWNTSYRGPLAIHAAVGKYVDDYLLMRIEPFYSVLREAGIESRLQIPLGAIIATCDLVHVKQIDELIHFPACRAFAWQKRLWQLEAQERAFGDYSMGRYMWLLENIVMLPEPIPAKGALSLWECEIPIDTGDHVHHAPTDEDWVVAAVNGDDLYWCGYPFGGSAKLADCTLLKKATAESRLGLLRQLAAMEGNERPVILAKARLTQV